MTVMGKGDVGKKLEEGEDHTVRGSDNGHYEISVASHNGSRAIAALRVRIVFCIISLILACVFTFISGNYLGQELSSKHDLLTIVDSDHYNLKKGEIASFSSKSDLSAVAAASLLFISFATYFIVNYLQYGKFTLRQKDVAAFASLPRFIAPSPQSNDEDLQSALGLDPEREPRRTDGKRPDLSPDRLWFFTSERLNLEIRALGRRGNVNLVIGMVTTFAGVCLLALVVFGEPPPYSGSGTQPANSNFIYLLHFFARISIALFVEVFAYFFLRLYRTSLEDIKYYQNEMTNIESRALAVTLLGSSADPVLPKVVLECLARTERNFILKKGESTLGLERDRMDKNEFLDVMKQIVKATSATKK